MIWWILGGFGAFLVGCVAHDLTQRSHAVIRNFPVIGHFRYWLEAIGPELRQYIVTDNDEERPFSRDQRRWVYTSSKRANNYFGFGTDNHLEHLSDYLIVKQATFPLSEPEPDSAAYDRDYTTPSAKVLGAARGRAKAFRPNSIINVSAMSFGSLSGNAVAAVNRGVKLAGALQNTGEGGLSRHHQHGGELVWQIGTGYFGCREADGRFSLERLKQVAAANPVRALEIKLSQGAKPAKGGILPAAKISAEIAEIRGIPMDRDCVSPAAHSQFHDADSLLDFVERLGEATGLPVGIKSAVGELGFWHDLARLMESGTRGVDFITIDGGEGGTGAAPLVFTDHVSLPFRMGMARVYSILAERGLQEKVTFIGSGRLGFPDMVLVAFALGCDMVNVAREAMLSIGCIQAQRCHTGHCPTGVATQNRWLMRGLDPTLKSARLANYLTTLRKEVLNLCWACGVAHPAFISGEHLEFVDSGLTGRPLHEVFGYKPEWGFPSAADRAEIRRIMGAGSEAEPRAVAAG